MAALEVSDTATPTTFNQIPIPKYCHHPEKPQAGIIYKKNSKGKIYEIFCCPDCYNHPEKLPGEDVKI